MSRVILSLFPGIGLFDRGFEALGFCVVRGPDLLWGGDVRRFFPPANFFWGIIGGSPCQDFSAARRTPPTGLGRELLLEFCRVVLGARPVWWLLENVPRTPNVVELLPELSEAYPTHQRIDVQAAWYSGVSRLRHFQFGSRDGRLLDVPRGVPVKGAEPAALARDGRTLAELIRLQGLPADFVLPGFTVDAAKAAVGNGVPDCLSKTLARAVARAYGVAVDPVGPTFDETACIRRRCACGCGRVVRGRHQYDSAACRKRAERQRRKGTGRVGT